MTKGQKNVRRRRKNQSLKRNLLRDFLPVFLLTSCFTLFCYFLPFFFRGSVHFIVKGRSFTDVMGLLKVICFSCSLLLVTSSVNSKLAIDKYALIFSKIIEVILHNYRKHSGCSCDIYDIFRLYLTYTLLLCTLLPKQRRNYNCCILRLEK